MAHPAAILARPLLAVVVAIAVVAGAGAPAAQAADAGTGRTDGAVEVRGAARIAADARVSSKGDAVPEKRIAFVIGDGAYSAGPLPTAVNDAALIAQTLQMGGFEVIGARDLDGEALRQSYADFLKRLAEAGPDTVAFVYLSGYGLQYRDSNYFVPVGAAVSGAIDIPVQSVRLSDLTDPLAALPLRARFAVFDAAYRAPFALDGVTTGGLSLIDAGPNSLVAFNAAPGTVAAPGRGNFGLYALALASTMREPGLSPEQLFEQVRLRVAGGSEGGEVPWDAGQVDAGFRFFEADASAKVSKPAEAAAAAAPRPINQAYPEAVARDTVDSYDRLVRRFAGEPLALRGRAMLAVRREALTWRQTLSVGTPAAFWSYLDRYGKGPHAELSRRRLAELSAPPAAPAGSDPIRFDVPPPPGDELRTIETSPVDLADPALKLPPAPATGSAIPTAFRDLPRPAAAAELFRLPVPAALPLPAGVEPPATVAYPAANPFYASSFGGGVPFGGNILVSDRMVVGRIHSAAPGGVALPLAVRRRSAMLEQRGIVTTAQLDALRSRPGGLAAALAQRGASLLDDPQVPVAATVAPAAAPATASTSRPGAPAGDAAPAQEPLRVGRSIRTVEAAVPAATIAPAAPRSAGVGRGGVTTARLEPVAPVAGARPRGEAEPLSRRRAVPNGAVVADPRTRPSAIVPLHPGVGAAPARAPGHLAALAPNPAGRELHEAAPLDRHRAAHPPALQRPGAVEQASAAARGQSAAAADDLFVDLGGPDEDDAPPRPQTKRTGGHPDRADAARRARGGIDRTGIARAAAPALAPRLDGFDGAYGAGFGSNYGGFGMN